MKKIISALLVCVLLVGCMFVLASCGGPNSDPAKALDALKDKDYLAAEDKLVIPNILKGLGAKGVETLVTGSKKDDEGYVQTVTIVYFEDAASANESWEAVKDYADDKKEGEDSQWVVAKSGAMIYWGTKQAVADAA